MSVPPWVEKCFQLKLGDPHLLPPLSEKHRTCSAGRGALLKEDTTLIPLLLSESSTVPNHHPPPATRSMMEESKWAEFNTCIIGNQKHKKQKKKRHPYSRAVCWLTCPSRSLFSQLSVHFHVIKIIQLSCFSTHHGYLPKYQSHAILITNNTPLHQFHHLEGSLLKRSHVSSVP